MSIKPPRPKGPSLNALRAFEAAARLGGFTAASEELNVSPAAVAQQIKNLEDWVGAPLFERHSQGVRLTELGAESVEGFETAFDQLGDAVQAMKAQAGSAGYSIAALPSVAQCWLVPRLPALRRSLPDIGLSVTALETPPNLAREAFDFSIFFEVDPLPPDGIPLARDRISPVCTPEVARKIETLQDLATVPCLRDIHWTRDWDKWLDAAGCTPTPRLTGPAFSLYSLALDAARASGGVLMGHECLVAPWLEKGDLVRPFELSVETGRWLTLRSAGRPNTRMQSVIDALRAPEA